MAISSNVLFTNGTSGTPDSYLWDFGDGITSTQVSPVHTYTTTGVYIVRLTASKAGVKSSVAKTVPILAAGTTLTLLSDSTGRTLATAGADLIAAV